MSELEECCSICLQHGTFFKSITEVDESNKTYLNKLEFIAPKQEWLDFYEICSQCIESINAAYSFCTLCFELETLRKEKIIKKVPTCKEELSDLEECVSENFFELNDCNEIEQKQHICDLCTEEFQTKKALITHKKTTHTKRQEVPDKFFCEFCNEKFSFIKSIKEHYNSVHSLSEKQIKPYACKICNNRFNSSGTYYQHMKYHSGVRTFVCSKCGKSFVTKRDLINHEYIHSETRAFHCVACDKWFNTKRNLNTHNLVVHTDSSVWKFECNICNKKFPLKTNYEQHVQRHTGEKNFTCDICPGEKSFVTHTELKRHIERHSNVKFNKCEHCDKEYRSKDSLNKHLASAHGVGLVRVRERKHMCNYCSSTFYDKSKLTRHMYSHTGEKPYVCHVCNKGFTDKSYIKGHMRNAHGIVENTSV